ncbi:hypothetical protein [Spirillospora sp. CA-294931]
MSLELLVVMLPGALVALLVCAAVSPGDGRRRRNEDTAARGEGDRR